MLNLTINAETPADVTDLTVCEAELPYEWNGQTLNAAGQLVNTVTDANGCEYEEVLNLTVNASQADAIEAVTICAGELPYDWRGQTLTAAGQYSNEIADDNGCAYNEVLNLTVNASQADAIEAVTICATELPYEWRGQALTAAGQYINGIIDDNDCAYNEVLNLTVNASQADEVTDLNICSEELPYDWNGQTLSSEGQYIHTVSDNNGCGYLEVLNLTVDRLELVSQLANSECNAGSGNSNGSITIMITGGDGVYTYLWSGAGIQQGVANQSGLAAGQYAVTVTDGKGCSVEDAWILTEPTSISVTAETTNLSCNESNGIPNGKIDISVRGGQGSSDSDYRYSWASSNGIGLIPTIADQQGLGNGTYEVTVTDQNGCSATGSWTLEEPAILSVLASVTDVSCTDASGLPNGVIDISVQGGTPGYTFAWSTNNGEGLKAAESSQTNLTAGTYFLVVSDANGCIQEESYTLDQQQASTPDEITEETICGEDLPYDWYGESITESGQYVNTVIDNSGCSYNQILNLTVNAAKLDEITDDAICASELPYIWKGETITASGQYTNQQLDANGCIYNEVLNLTVNADVNDEVTEKVICEEELPYSWNGELRFEAGEYSHPVTDAGGCGYNEILILTVSERSEDQISETTVCSEDLPFMWNGQAINESGTLMRELQDAAGCSYNEIINVTVRQMTEDEVTSVEVCEGDLPYVWENQSYNSEGSYSIDKEDAAGCGFKSILNLTVQPSEEPQEFNEVICQGDSYTWELNNVTYESEGRYTTPSEGNCAVDHVLNLTFHTRGSEVVRNATICDGDVYMLEGEVFESAGVFVVMMQDDNGCELRVILDLEVIQTEPPTVYNEILCYGETYTWVLNDQIYTTPGQYTTPSFGECAEDHILNLTFYEQTEDLVIADTICTGGIYTLGSEFYFEPGTYYQELSDDNGCPYGITLNLAQTSCARSSLGNLIWDDANGNGIQDDNEQGIAEVTVDLFGADNQLVASMETDAAGHYTFEDLHPGDYYLVAKLPAGSYEEYIPTFIEMTTSDKDNDFSLDESGAMKSKVVALGEGEEFMEMDGGFYASASIGDQIWLELEESSLTNGFDQNDEPLGGVRITIFDAQTEEPIKTQMSDDNGFYKFDNLPIGVYYLEFIAEEGYTFIEKNGVNNKELDSDVERDPFSTIRGVTSRISVGVGEQDFTVDAGLRVNTTLGIELLDFEVEYAEEEHLGLVFWSTSSESNTKNFEIERSIDGINQFEVIGKEESAGNSREVSEYSFVDNNLKSGVHYYRLKAIDLDGSFTYTETRSITIEPQLEKSGISVYPNPAMDEVYIDIEKADPTTRYNGGILNVIGESLIDIEETETNNESRTKLLVDISSLTEGSYVCRIQIGTEVFIKKLIVTRSE